MKWVEVDSRSIAEIGYDAFKSELGIRFRESGKTYLYEDVPAEEYQTFMAAESKGAHLNQVFKPKGYRYRVETE